MGGEREIDLEEAGGDVEDVPECPDLAGHDVVSIAADEIERLMAMSLLVPPVLLAEIRPTFQVACAVDGWSGRQRKPVRADPNHGASQADRLALVVRIREKPGRWPLRPINALLAEGSGGDRLLPGREGILRDSPTATDREGDHRPSESDWERHSGSRHVGHTRHLERASPSPTTSAADTACDHESSEPEKRRQSA
jgi:hypothetical protein